MTCDKRCGALTSGTFHVWAAARRLARAMAFRPYAPPLSSSTPLFAWGSRELSLKESPLCQHVMIMIMRLDQKSTYTASNELA